MPALAIKQQVPDDLPDIVNIADGLAATADNLRAGKISAKAAGIACERFSEMLGAVAKGRDGA